MPCSPAQREANRKNAARSTGPRTAEGKEKSRANSLKHGMTGEGVVLLEEDQSEVANLAGQLEAEMRPSGAMGRILLWRIAVMAVRLDRCVENDEAMTAKRVRDAERTHQEALHEEAKALAARIDDDPGAALRGLKETAEGIEQLVLIWLAIKGALLRPDEIRWHKGHLDRIANLLGRAGNDNQSGRFDALGRAVMGDFSRWPQGKQVRSVEKRKALARETVAAMIDAEVEVLRATTPTRDEADEAQDLAEAPSRALFDPSAEAERARKYEAAAERGMFRALREFRQVEDQAKIDPPAPTPEPPAVAKTKPIQGPAGTTSPDAKTKPIAGYQGSDSDLDFGGEDRSIVGEGRAVGLPAGA